MKQTLDLTLWVLWVPCTANYVQDFFTPIQVYYSDIHFWFSSTTYSLNYCNTIWSSHLFSLCTHLTILFRANERYDLSSSGTWSMKMSNKHLVSLHVCVHHCVCCVSWLGGWKYADWMCKRVATIWLIKKTYLPRLAGFLCVTTSVVCCLFYSCSLTTLCCWLSIA